MSEEEGECKVQKKRLDREVAWQMTREIQRTERERGRDGINTLG